MSDDQIPELSGDPIAETLRKLRELVGACEKAGWDGTENEEVLNGGREALADLEVVLA